MTLKEFAGVDSFYRDIETKKGNLAHRIHAPYNRQVRT